MYKTVGGVGTAVAVIFALVVGYGSGKTNTNPLTYVWRCITGIFR